VPPFALVGRLTSMRILLAPLTALLAVLFVAACGGPERGPAAVGARGQRVPAVEAVEVGLGRLPLEERLVGSVRARNQTEIFAEIAGPIVEVLVDDGDRVAAGDPLVRLRDSDYVERVRQAGSALEVAAARVTQAEANLARVEATLRRIRTLSERGLSSGAELDTAEADALLAAADLQLMRAQAEQARSLRDERRTELEETVVRAPIGGVVGGRNAEVGRLTDPGTSLFVIGDTERMRIEVTLTQRMLGYIEPGMVVNVLSDANPDAVIESRIARISPFLHPVTHTTRAEIDVDEPRGLLRPGMFVTVDVLYGQSTQAPLAPNAAIYRHPRDGREGVYVASVEDAIRGAEGRRLAADDEDLEPIGPVGVSFVPVRVIARGRLSSAVDGIEPGDWVVTLGHHLLSASAGEQAIIQPTPWEHIMDLQQMQSRDLLDVIRAKQEAAETRVPN
jgi:HlyD family secretion protein